MDRMLGNKHFVEGRFQSAIPHLEATVERYAADWPSVRKLVLSYLATDQVEPAARAFLNLVQKGGFAGTRCLAAAESRHGASLYAGFASRLRQDPGNWQVHLGAAILAVLLGYPDHRHHFECASRLTPENKLIVEMSSHFQSKQEMKP